MTMKPIDPKEIFSSEPKELEQYIVDNPDQFFPDWWLVGRQLSTDEGEADLVYVEPDGGCLVVVELKLGNADRRTIGQVAEYAEFLTSLTPSALSMHISNHSGKNGVPEIVDFASEWTMRFGEGDDSADMPICAIIAGTGMTHATHRTASNLELSGGVMRAMIIHAETDGTTSRAYAEMLGVPEPRQWWFPPAGAKRQQLREWLFEEAAKTEAANLHAEITGMIATTFPFGRWVPRVDPDSLGLNWTIRGRNGKPVESITIRIHNHDPKSIFLMLFDEVVQYAPRKLRAALQPFTFAQGLRLNKPHGESREIDAETWAEHGQALRDALAYAGAKHAKQTT